MGVFSHHILKDLNKYIALGRIRGYDFHLAIEVKFDWYSFDKQFFVSTISIREYSNV
jgi:hypothetical protein